MATRFEVAPVPMFLRPNAIVTVSFGSGAPFAGDALSAVRTAGGAAVMSGVPGTPQQ